jgi:hypothetical protein
MTTIARAGNPRPVPGPCLTAGPWAGPIISGFFAATVVLFLLGLLLLAT